MRDKRKEREDKAGEEEKGRVHLEKDETAQVTRNLGVCERDGSVNVVFLSKKLGPMRENGRGKKEKRVRELER